MIKEQTIDTIVARYENDQELYETSLGELMDDQPALLAFLTQESSDVLTEDEKDITWYIVLIIINACIEDGLAVPELEDDLLSDSEEINWEIYQETPKGTFRDRITPLFEGYVQEDLLAFVEDTLEIEEDSPVTSVGREVMFITSKSVIDSIFSKK